MSLPVVLNGSFGRVDLYIVMKSKHENRMRTRTNHLVIGKGGPLTRLYAKFQFFSFYFGQAKDSLRGSGTEFAGYRQTGRLHGILGCGK